MCRHIHTLAHAHTHFDKLYFVSISNFTGKEAVQRLVGAGSACVSARAFLSATARHLLTTPDQALSLRGSKETREDGEVSYNDLVWRYLELGVRGRACVFALRRAAQELAGSRGHRSSSNNKKGGVAREDEGGDVDAAAARLEEGLNVGENTMTRANNNIRREGVWDEIRQCAVQSCVEPILLLVLLGICHCSSSAIDGLTDWL